jgi:hypothetical protein
MAGMTGVGKTRLAPSGGACLTRVKRPKECRSPGRHYVPMVFAIGLPCAKMPSERGPSNTAGAAHRAFGQHMRN